MADYGGSKSVLSFVPVEIKTYLLVQLLLLFALFNDPVGRDKKDETDERGEGVREREVSEIEEEEKEGQEELDQLRHSRKRQRCKAE